SVCLTAQNTAGCSQTLCQEDLVNIISPIAEATYTSGINNCLYGVTFQNNTPGTISSSVWDFGDQQFGNGLAVFHTYPIGVFDVELVVINDFGCSDTLILEDILNLGDVIGSYDVTLDDVVCAPFQTSFEAHNTTDNTFTYFWEFDDGSGDANNVTSTQHTYNEPGEYCPSLIMEDVNDCTVFVPCEVPFTVEEFTIDVTQPESVCVGEEQFVSATGATSYGWSDPTGITTTNDGEWTALIDQTTTYGLTGYFEDCENTVDVTFAVNQLPNTQLPIQEEVCFEEEDIILDMGLPLDGVDGSGIYYVESVISTAFSPSLPFDQSYEVVYAFTDNNGCHNADTTSVFIHPLPLVEFPNLNDACESDPEVVLSNATPVGGVYSLDGTELVAFQPNLGMGDYELNYSYTDLNGCTNTDQSIIVVHPLPAPDFSVEDLCFGTGLSLGNQSTIPEGAIANHVWMMGDGEEIIGDQVQGHLYGSPGVYEVQLTAASMEGCVDTVSYSVNVLTSPEVDFEIDNGCLVDLFTSNNLTEIVGGAADSYLWLVNGESVSNQENIIDLAFDEHGTYNIQLVVESNEGCVDSLAQTIEVYPMPELEFEVDDICVDDLFSFDNFSSIDEGVISGYDWNPGDGSENSSTQQFQYAYNTPGVYDVSLTATSDQNCVTSLTQEITVFAAPIIQYGQDATADCGLAEVNFEDFSTAENSQIASWQWLLNGTLISGQPTATFNPSEPGSYDVELVVISAEGCISDSLITNAFEVYPIPEVQYEAPTSVSMIDPNATIEDLTAGASYWEITSPDGIITNDSALDYEFPAEGEYVFNLYVENEFGCADSTSILILAFEEMLVHIPNAFTPDGDGVNEVFFPVINDIDLESYQFEIYNRWGEAIFVSNTKGEGWLGNVNNGGHYAQNGVYTYKLTLKEEKRNDVRTFTGHVTLIK
ncbi:MAG: gliding motility-associated C-terminal domain-containing protein, partial [Flavobacteriales bacterium]|nr:gliding motility-associated C-terminal domain-containing protein [Flavobacteriales bacterium]